MELDPNIAEINRETLIVPYGQWHPPTSDRLWQRLEIPGRPKNGSYKHQGEFDWKTFWDAEREKNC